MISFKQYISEQYKKGDKIEVTGGNFSGQTGIVGNYDDDETIQIQLQGLKNKPETNTGEIVWLLKTNIRHITPDYKMILKTLENDK